MLVYINRKETMMTQTVPTLAPSTGWHFLDGQWGWVHAGGVIGAAGSRRPAAPLPGVLSRYDLPEPTTDPAVLRAAFLNDSAGVLRTQQPSVAAPVLGYTYRSALGHNRFPLALVGPAGSYKNSLAALMMQHWGAGWGQALGAGLHCSTGNSLRYHLHAAKDTLFWVDDPRTEVGLAEFVRVAHNAEQQGQSTRNNAAMSVEEPMLIGEPRGSALITSEIVPSAGSALQSLLVVPVNSEALDIEHLRLLDAEDSRQARAVLMASMLRWLAADLERSRDRARHEADRQAATARRRGISAGSAQMIGEIRVGWTCMTAFLVEVGSLGAGEAEDLLAQVDVGLRAALAASGAA